MCSDGQQRAAQALSFFFLSELIWSVWNNFIVECRTREDKSRHGVPSNLIFSYESPGAAPRWCPHRKIPSRAPFLSKTSLKGAVCSLRCNPHLTAGGYTTLFAQFISEKDNIIRDLEGVQSCHTSCKLARFVFWWSKCRANKTFFSLQAPRKYTSLPKIGDSTPASKLM